MMRSATIVVALLAVTQTGAAADPSGGKAVNSAPRPMDDVHIHCPPGKHIRVIKKVDGNGDETYTVTSK